MSAVTPLIRGRLRDVNPGCNRDAGVRNGCDEEKSAARGDNGDVWR